MVRLFHLRNSAGKGLTCGLVIFLWNRNIYIQYVLHKYYTHVSRSSLLQDKAFKLVRSTHKYFGY